MDDSQNGISRITFDEPDILETPHSLRSHPDTDALDEMDFFHLNGEQFAFSNDLLSHEAWIEDI